jgi:hypothetical protein
MLLGSIWVNTSSVLFNTLKCEGKPKLKFLGCILIIFIFTSRSSVNVFFLSPLSCILPELGSNFFFFWHACTSEVSKFMVVLKDKCLIMDCNLEADDSNRCWLWQMINWSFLLHYLVVCCMWEPMILFCCLNLNVY